MTNVLYAVRFDYVKFNEVSENCVVTSVSERQILFMYFDSCLCKDMEHERELMIVCGLQTKAGTCLGLFYVIGNFVSIT